MGPRDDAVPPPRYVHVGPRVLDFDGKAQVSVLRTLRVPESGEWPLPPGLGTFPLRRADDLADRLPPGWARPRTALVPMYVREAMWLQLSASEPIALQVAVGGICALTGAPLLPHLEADPQNYLLLPEQPWLDGINSGNGTVSQFVAIPQGLGATVEGQVTGRETRGGIQLVAWRLGEQAWEIWRRQRDLEPPAVSLGAAMGVGAGGTIRQEIYRDDRPRTDWADTPFGDGEVRLVPAGSWRELTGEGPPSTPVDVDAYSKAGLPFFDYYAADMDDVPASATLTGVRRTGEWFGEEAEEHPNGPVIHLGPGEERPDDASGGGP